MLGLMAVLVANANELWCVAAGDSDPRGNVGDYAIILHNRDRAGHVVIRSPDGGYHDFNYRPIAVTAWTVAGVCVAGILVLQAPALLGRQ